MSTWLRTLIAFTLPVALSVGVGWAAEQPGGAAAFAPCADCHDTVAAQFLSNPHASGTATVSGKAICESCHGDGTKHAEEGGDKALITVPKGGAGAKQCLACHQGRDTFDHTAMGFHASASVNCDDCHSVHAASATPLAEGRRPQPCASAATPARRSSSASRTPTASGAAGSSAPPATTRTEGRARTGA